LSGISVKSILEGLDEAARIVKNGGVVALPYERLFGLAANALDARTVDKVAAIKGRDLRGSRFWPIAVIASDLKSVLDIVDDFTPLAFSLAGKYWPGPLTMLVRAQKGLPTALLGPSGLIGVRVPGPCPAADLAVRTGLVLTATSANRHLGDDALSHEDVAGIKGVDLIIEGDVPGPPGSTVVDASGSRPIVVRSGCIDIEEVP
jgi:L-threonylcarbamoyladenylate synthase